MNSEDLIRHRLDSILDDSTSCVMNKQVIVGFQSK